MANRDAPERTLAVILHADVAGSTELVHLDEAVAHARITDAFYRLSDAIRSYRGAVHEIRGDALLADFPRASDAVSCAIAFQNSNAAANASIDDGIAPQIRIGISLGEVIIADRTVTGAGVVLAQRVEQLAEPGGVCVTAAIHEAAPGRLPFDYVDLGARTAKGFDEPVQVYAVVTRTGGTVPSPEPLRATAGRTARRGPVRWLAAPTLGLVVVVGALAWLQPWSPGAKPARQERMAFPLPDKPSIAVLPFESVGGDASKAQLADGFGGTLTSALASAPRLFVISNRSTAKYRGQAIEPRVVVEEQGVQYVLSGSIQWAGDDMRVTVQLTDALNGEYLWSERYDRSSKEFFEVQDDIARHVLAAVESELVWEQGPVLWAGMTRDLDAYISYLKGQKELFRFSQAGNAAARTLATRAIELDPDFSAGWNLLGWTYYHEGRVGWGLGTGQEKWAKATEYAKKSIELAPTYGSPRSMLSAIARRSGDFERAQSLCREAVQVAPNEAITLASCSGTARAAGYPQEALALVNRALRLAPKHPAWFAAGKGWALYFLGEFNQAIEAFEGASQMGSKMGYAAKGALAASYAGAGRRQKAVDVVSELIRDEPDLTAQALVERASLNPEFEARLTRDLVALGLPDKPIGSAASSTK